MIVHRGLSQRPRADEPPRTHRRLLALQAMRDLPMLCLSFVWLCVLIAEMVSTTNEILSGIGIGCLSWRSLPPCYALSPFSGPSRSSGR